MSEIICALLHQCLTLKEDATIEDWTETEDTIEEETSILVNSATVKNSNPADIRNLIFNICKKKPNSNTNVNKASTRAKELLVCSVTYLSIKKHNITCSVSKVDRVRNHSLIDCRANVAVAGEDFRVRFTHPA